MAQDPDEHGPNRASVRSLAGQAKLPVVDAILLLQDAGFAVKHPSNKLEGEALRDAREALGLRAWGDKPEPARRLSEAELIVQCLRPLREKCKVGRTHTSPIESVYGHGIPDHQKNEARDLVDRLVAQGHLLEKPSQGRRHVWLSREGQARLALAELDEAREED